MSPSKVDLSRQAGPRLAIFLLCLLTALFPIISTTTAQAPSPASRSEYLWLEAENMRGFATQPTGEPVLNPSWQNLGKGRAPGWGINGPGVSAEWSQGGESEWNSAAASADETAAKIYQDVEIPRSGNYKVWVRYADWATRSENFVVQITRGADAATRRSGDQEGAVSASPSSRVSASPEVFRHEFGTKDIIDPHDEVSMYWGWAFTWQTADVKLEKGPARISIGIESAADARRHVDCLLLTNDLTYVPEGRRKPDFAGMRYLREWSTTRPPLASLINTSAPTDLPAAWQRPKIAGRDFLMPWNVATDFWKLYDKPVEERPLFPFNAEPIEEFVQKYRGLHDVPIFSSKLVVPVIYINSLPEYFKEGSPFLRYLRETKAPFAVVINYGSAQMSDADGQAAWKLLNGELREQFLGWISGESVGYVWDRAPAELKISPSMSRRELLEAHRIFYTNAIARKWAGLFHTQTGAGWNKLIPAQSTSSTSFAHALAEWGVKLLGMETAAVQPMFAMRIAFTRGAARQYGGSFLYYHAPNFGDTATTFTKQQNFAGPDNFFHSRYGATMGPSLSWYRKSYYLYYMSGASAIYLEQGFDQFFKPGPGSHDFQLNPLGRITDEFMRFTEKHPDRGTPYTPIAFLLDPAHGWEMTDYPHWPFGVSQINRSDRSLRELFGVAYYPGLVVESEPATGDRQAFVNGIFGDIFDVLVASPNTEVTARDGSTAPLDEAQRFKAAPYLRVPPSHDRPSTRPLRDYRAIVVGGRIDWSDIWADKVADYVLNGGAVVLNAAQVKGLPEQLLGIRLNGASARADSARCLSPGEAPQDLNGQMFSYEKIELKGAQTLINSDKGDPLVTVNKVGKGLIVFSALPDLLGEDGRITPFAAHMLAHVFSDATPIKVRGDVEYLINRSDTGWIVTLFNNNGVIKPQQGLAQVDRSAYVTVAISLRSSQIHNAIEWISEKPLEVKNQNGENGVTLSIAPGGVSIVELSSRRKAEGGRR
jgi:hypothetical protein